MWRASRGTPSLLTNGTERLYIKCYFDRLPKKKGMVNEKMQLCRGKVVKKYSSYSTVLLVDLEMAY